VSITHEGNEGEKRTTIVTLPPHFPTLHTRETVTHLVAFGNTVEQIAVILKCTPEDVKLYYAEELEHGLVRINARVQAAVLNQALHKEDTNAMKLWLINKAGWRSGDGNRVGVLNLPPGAPNPEEAVTVVQKREIITRVLTHVTKLKRGDERVLEGEFVETRPNGNGHGGSNGTKHR
jgi:hypothetical protein